MVDDNEATLTFEEFGNLFKDTSSEGELGTEWFQVNLQALQVELSSLQEPANTLQIQIDEQKDANFPVKTVGIDVIASYATGANITCMSCAGYMKWKKTTIFEDCVCNVSTFSYQLWYMHCRINGLWNYYR